MTPNEVLVGIGPPEIIQITVGASLFDLTTVTAVSFTVRLPDSTTAAWSGFLQPGASKTLLVVAHAFVTTDCQQIGDYIITPTLTVPGGSLQVAPVSLRVRDGFGN